MLRNLLLALIFFSWTYGQAQSILRGMVEDKADASPLAYAQLRLLQAGEGIITNEEGRFSLSLDAATTRDTLVISYIGYQSVAMPLETINMESEVVIQMESAGVTLDSVLIIPVTAEELLRQALAAVPDNYHSDPVMADAFYRELIQQNGDYVEISEAVLEVYKTAPGLEPNRNGQIRMVKGRSHSTPQKLERMSFSVGAGHPEQIVGLPVVGHTVTYSFLDEDNFRLYEYEIIGTTTYENRDVWIIEFDQGRKLRKRLYKGRIYIDVKTMGLALVEYEISPRGKKFRMSQGFTVGERAQLAMAAAFGYKFRITDDRGRIAFTWHNGSWYMSHIWEEIDAYAEAPSIEEVREVYMGMRREIVYSEIHFGEAARPIPAEQRLEEGMTLPDQVGDYDANFWENYQHLELSRELQAIFSQ